MFRRELRVDEGEEPRCNLVKPGRGGTQPWQGWNGRDLGHDEKKIERRMKGKKTD